VTVIRTLTDALLLYVKSGANCRVLAPQLTPPLEPVDQPVGAQPPASQSWAVAALLTSIRPVGAGAGLLEVLGEVVALAVGPAAGVADGLGLALISAEGDGLGSGDGDGVGVGDASRVGVGLSAATIAAGWSKTPWL
jgi:hypothetical protein